MLPNLVVIGAPKCGTTSLHAYLGLHPQVFMSRRKELNFFRARGTWRRGVRWYASHFDARAPVRGESSPQYSNRFDDPGMAERMAAVLPDAKLVYLVRDPVARVVSHYLQRYCEREEHRSLAASLRIVDDTNSYVAYSKYFTQLSAFLEHYPMERILVLASEDLDHRREATLAEVFSFVGVDPSFSSPGFAVRKHESAAKNRLTPLGNWSKQVVEAHFHRVIPEPVRIRLGRSPLLAQGPAPLGETLEGALLDEVRDYLREDVEAFRVLVGKPFAGWSL